VLNTIVIVMFKSVMPTTGTAAHAGRLPSCSPGNPFPDTPRSSAPSSLFGEWTDSYMGLRNVAEGDGDESMSSSPLISPTIDGPTLPDSMLAIGAGEDATAAWAIPSPGLARVDSSDLAGIVDMRLSDGSLSPPPPALVPTFDLADPLGIAEVDLTAAPPWTVPGEDTTTPGAASYASCRFGPSRVSRDGRLTASSARLCGAEPTAE